MSHPAPNTLSSKGPSGAARIRKIFSRIYGTLAVLFGLFGVGLAALIIWVRTTGGSVRGFLGISDGSLEWFDPDMLPAFFGPYHLVTSLVSVVLGVLIIRQRTIAGIAYLGFTVVVDVLSGVLPGNFPPALNGGSFTNISVIYYAILLTLTVAIVIADRAARRVPQTRV